MDFLKDKKFIGFSVIGISIFIVMLFSNYGPSKRMPLKDGDVVVTEDKLLVGNGRALEPGKYYIYIYSSKYSEDKASIFYYDSLNKKHRLGNVGSCDMCIKEGEVITLRTGDIFAGEYAYELILRPVKNSGSFRGVD